jgi:hypothetical protein
VGEVVVAQPASKVAIATASNSGFIDWIPEWVIRL